MSIDRLYERVTLRSRQTLMLHSEQKSIKKMFDNKDVVVHCPTRELWNKVREKAQKENDDTIDEDYWNEYEEETCLDIEDDSLTYCDKDYFINELPNRKLVSAEEYLGLKGGRKSKPAPVNFLLKYDLDEDPIEEFETMAQVKERIDYLVQNERSLKRDSIVVYTIKKKQRVTVKTNISLHA